MSKLNGKHCFLDTSDYMRLPGRFLANIFQHTPFRAITFTWLFLISGLISCYYFLRQNLMFGSVFFILKILLDTVDGEISRLTNEPRYTGRYLDAIADYILNGLYMVVLYCLDSSPFYFYIISFLSMSLQGTLFNYYYVVKRIYTNGDTTSRVFEYQTPKAFPYESQFLVNILHKIFLCFYGWLDIIVYRMDPGVKGSQLPNWFLTAVSVFGLGTQLAVILICLILNKPFMAVIYFSIVSNIYALVLVGIRRTLKVN